MSNYIRSNKTGLLQYRLEQALAALEDVEAMYKSTEYELRLVELKKYLLWCALEAERYKFEDMK